MTKETQAITSGALYLNQNRKVAVLDYNKKYIKNIFELINSDELRSVVSQFLASRKQVDSNTTFEKRVLRLISRRLNPLFWMKKALLRHLTDRRSSSIEDLSFIVHF